MQTEELIRALAADGSRPVTPFCHILWRARALGVLLSTALFLLNLHPRFDIGLAILTPRFDFKLIVAACVAVAAAIFLGYVALPASSARHRCLLYLAPFLL